MAAWLVRMICVTCRLYLLNFPFYFGKHFIWNHVLRPFVLQRSLALRAVTKFGALVDGELPDVIHSYLYFLGMWEPGITRVIRQHLRPGDHCIDIGANVGAHTLLAAHLVGPAGRVHAIEASPSIHRRLMHNLEINHLTQAVAYNLAVTDVTGPVTIFLHDIKNLGGTTIMPAEAKARETSREVVVEGRPLTAILPAAEIQAARLIKIDVEGAEWLVLQGMREILPTLKDDCLILIELSAEALAEQGRTITDVIELFASKGWEHFEIANPYLPNFYFKPLGRVLTSQIRQNATLLDLGFARPKLRDALFEQDRACS